MPFTDTYHIHSTYLSSIRGYFVKKRNDCLLMRNGAIETTKHRALLHHVKQLTGILNLKIQIFRLDMMLREEILIEETP